MIGILIKKTTTTTKKNRHLDAEIDMHRKKMMR